MATLLTDLATAQAATNWRTALYPSDKEKARHLYAEPIYTCTGAEAAGDVIQLVGLPIGSKVVADNIKVITDGVGGTTSTVASIGDAGSASRYSATAVAIVSAGINAVTAVNGIVLTPYAIAAGNEIVTATLGLASGSYTALKLIKFRIPYILP